MAIGDKLFIADKPTLDAVKEDTFDILQNIRNVNEASFANAGDILSLDSGAKVFSYKNYIISIGSASPYTITIIDKDSNVITTKVWSELTPKAEFIELDDNILLFYSGLDGNKVTRSTLKILNLNTKEWKDFNVYFSETMTLTCARYIKEEKRLYLFRSDTSNYTYLYYLDIDTENMTMGNMDNLLAQTPGTPINSLRIAELIKVDRGYYVFAYGSGSATINYFYEVSDIEQFIKNKMEVYTRKLSMGKDRIRDYNNYYRKKYIKINGDNILVLTTYETWCFSISTFSQKQYGYIFVDGIIWSGINFRGVNLLTFFLVDNSAGAWFSILLSDVNGNLRFFNIRVNPPFIVASNLSYTPYLFGDETGLNALIVRKGSSGVPYSGAGTIELTKYVEGVLKLCGYQ